MHRAACIQKDAINCSNTRFKVLCSNAILLEITANLYAGRRNCEYESGANATGSASQGGKPHSKSRFCIPTQGGQRGEKDAVEAVGVRSRQPPFTRCESKTPEKSAFKTCKQLLSESTRLEDVKQIRPGQHHEQERPRSLSFR